MIAVTYHVDVLRLIGLGVVFAILLLLGVLKWLDGRGRKP